MMTPNELRTLLQSAGYRTQPQMANALGLSLIMVKQMLSGARDISKRTELMVNLLCKNNSQADGKEL